MVNGNSIRLHKMIIHQVDHHNYNQPQYSDVESPIDDEVGSFLQRHILRTRDHKNTKDAVFVDPGPGVISTRQICDELLADTTKFVDLSQTIANQLFQSMKSNKNISPGNLVICTYSGNTSESPRHLALLKMDPRDGFYGDRVTLNGGKIQTILRHVTGVLPTIGEDLESGLQKAALLLPSTLRNNELHLRVLDEQSKARGRRRPVASFFQVGFLQCRVDVNPDVQTDRYFEGSKNWIEKKKETWSYRDVERYNQHLRESLMEETVDIDAFARGVIEYEEEQEEYLQSLQDYGLRDIIFRPDPEVRERLTRYVKYRGDDDLFVRILATAVGIDKTLHYEFDNNTNEYVVTIRTQHWDER